MLAIPVKTNTVDSAIAPLFGKAKWFVIIDEKGEFKFWQNDLKSGRELAKYFHSIGVKNIIIQDIGGNPYLQLTQNGIECFHAGHGRILFKEAFCFFNDRVLTKITPTNMAEYVERPHRYRKAEHQELHHCGEHQHQHRHTHGH
ncbi:MAG: NifB/NifX family molybdenum-iron cluster-binding protein [Sulfuricurvum sp.]